jgi:uncharacterized protein (DUF2236 family)
MVVTRRELEGLLGQLGDSVSDPRAGLFGPGTMSWRVNREAVLLAGAGRAALLQLAHPAVSHAIEQHSPTRSDPQGRFVRTFTQVFAMLFGDLASTLEAARSVHLTHARIRGPISETSGGYPHGTRYAANDRAALLWVFATLVDTTLKTYSLLVHPLGRDERERYYDEAKRFGQLFGIAPEEFPRDWAAFQAYVRATLNSDALHVSRHARELSRFLLASPAPLFAPLMRSYRVFTAAMMPPPLREPYGLQIPAGGHAMFWLEVRALRGAVRTLPARLRFFPAYIDAKRRMQGKGPDRIAHFLERMVIRTLPQVAKSGGP